MPFWSLSRIQMAASEFQDSFTVSQQKWEFPTATWYNNTLQLTHDSVREMSHPYHTVYPKKYAHGFRFAVLCCGYTLTDFPISIRLTSLALWQSNDCPSASKATLMRWIWINTSCEFIMNDCITTTKQSTTKPCAYFLGYTVVGSDNHTVGNISPPEAMPHTSLIDIRLGLCNNFINHYKIPCQYDA